MGESEGWSVYGGKGGKGGRKCEKMKEGGGREMEREREREGERERYM